MRIVEITSVAHSVDTTLESYEIAYLFPKRHGIVWTFRSWLARTIAPKSIG